jgi:OOP family OmpA-OmpF porin
MRPSPSLWLGCLLMSTAVSIAQPREQVLRGAQVNERAVIELLSVEAPQAPAEGALRGFGPAVRAPMDRAGHGGPGKASLLITFPTDSAELPAESKMAIDVVGRALQSDKLAGLSFKVEGHADPRGSAERNFVLSQERAEAVVNYLVSHHGILSERLTSVGKGSAELLDSKHPDAPENRRVTIVTGRN